MELSIEEKAKRYDEAIKVAKEWHTDAQIGFKANLEKLFPELKESEDERIRKEMIFYFTEEILQCSIQEHSDKMRVFISWLKRQEVERTKLELKAGNSYFCYKSRWERADSETFKKGLIYKCNKDGILDNFVIKNPEQHFIEIKDERIAWLEKQGEMDMESYKTAEDEKREFVGDDFIKCYADFQDFKEGETYWLEYIGNDNYNVRSDNLLGKTYHITPCQLYTIFKKQTWLEKKGEQKYTPKHKIGDTIYYNSFGEVKSMIVANVVTDSTDNPMYEDENGSAVFEKDIIEQKSTDKIEPKFKVGDWIVNNADGSVDRITKILTDLGNSDEFEYEHTNGCFHNCFESNYHLWTIQDAKDGDVLTVDNVIFIYERTLAKHIVSYCKLINDIFEPSVDARTCCEGNTYVHPATKEQRDLLFQKMKESGYEWDVEKKELKKIEQKPTVWTIKDAKAGDVLNSVRVHATIIFKGFSEDGKHILAYCALQKGIFIKQEMLWDRDFEPASEYWKNALYDAMVKAGYEWDGDKLELKKIEQKTIEPDNLIEESYQQQADDLIDMVTEKTFWSEKNHAWSEEDDKMLNDILMCGERHCYLDAGNIAWLKSLKDRVQLQPKQEWSEEDEKRYISLHNAIYVTQDCAVDSNKKKELSDFLDSLKNRVQQQSMQEWSEEDKKCTRLSTDIIDSALRAGFCVQIDRDRCVDWLKSLKDRHTWKPSDEQMKALRRMKAAIAGEGEIYEPLNSLYEDLKKL